MSAFSTGQYGKAHESGQIKDLRARNNGRLPNSEDGYPLSYWDADGSILCPRCARSSINPSWDPSVRGYAINYEDADLYCDQCSKRIPPVYGN